MEMRHSSFNAHGSLALSIALPMVMIIMGEALLFSGSLYGCLILHLVNITVCVTAIVLLGEGTSLWHAFAMISLLRVLNLGMPRFETSSLAWLPLIYGPIIFVCVMQLYDSSRGREGLISLFREKTAVPSVALKYIYLPIFAVVVSLQMALIGFTILDGPFPNLQMIPDQSIGNMILALIVFVLFVGLGEELLFRKILQERLIKSSLSPLVAILVSSLAFAALYSSYESFLFIAYAFVVGAILGLIYYRFKSLILIIMIHGLMDFFLFAVLPFWL